MKISYNWLKDYVDLKVPAAKLAELLTMAGLAVDSLERHADDHILEIDVTANRPDWLSMIGVAREISALTGGKLKVPSVTKIRMTDDGRRTTIRVEDKALCNRYTARILRDVKIEESPAWLKTRLGSVGLRPVNNAVDITNFCLFETGVPMHAFDMDKLEGGGVIIRRAIKGERIVTIDGIERVLDESVLVIADSRKPVAIAGVMGGLFAEVTNSTRNLLLEVASFDPISIRRTSRKLGISTESSYRFERKVDTANIENSSNRAARLILETARGRAGDFIDICGRAEPAKEVTLRYERLNAILGTKISPGEVNKILTALGLKTKASSEAMVRCRIPSFRYDLNDEIDLVEEVSRIYGYDKIPATIPEILEQPVKRPYDMVVAEDIRNILIALGLDEIITYSLLARRLLETSLPRGKGLIEIKNPLTNEQEVMRPNLLAGMCGALIWNMNRKTKDLRFFELGRVYFKEGDERFVERMHLSIGLAGEASSNWAGGSRGVGFFDLKGIVEMLFSRLGIEKASFNRTSEDGFSPAEAASVEIEVDSVGVLGGVSPKVLNNFGIKEKVYFCEICIDSLMKHARLGKKFAGLPKYPSAARDISIVVDKKVPHSGLISAVREAAGAILKDIKLIDRYTGEQIPDDKVGLTYRLEYQDPKKTLEEKEVLEVHARVLQSLGERFGAKLR